VTYSNKRLVAVFAFWLLVGVFAASVYGLPVDITQEADADSGNCGAAPCMFPIESHVGGIVLGVGELSGQGATTFKVDGTGVTTPNGPGRLEPTDETIGLGLNNLDASDFFVYKSWKYDDPEIDNAEVNVWITANSAELTTEGSNDGCGDQNTDGLSDPREGYNCDLFLYAGEVSSGRFEADATVLGIPVGASTNGLWVNKPENDQCTPISFDPFDPGINICLQLIQDGTLASGDIGSTDITLFNFMTNAYMAKAVRDNGKNKRFTLNDGYLEIRHGKSAGPSRRSRVLTPANTEFGSAQWQEPIQQYGGDNPTERHGVSQGFRCEGSPDGSNCNIPEADRTGGDENDGAYDDIHDGGDNTAP
jgi:hypothetical protein